MRLVLCCCREAALGGGGIRSVGLDQFGLEVGGNQLHETSVGRSLLVVGPLPKGSANKYMAMDEYSATPLSHNLLDTHSAMKVSGVQVEKSALGIHLRFIGVSRVMGRMETTSESAGIPESLPANDLVS